MAETADRVVHDAPRLRTRATIVDALRAWFAGEFEQCLELCDRVPCRDDDGAAQVALLRSRALLRLGRPGDAQDVLQEAVSHYRSLDATISAQMLLGAAAVRLGDTDRGLRLLETARSRAAEAHETIRSEVALYFALAYYGLRDLERASAELDAVSPKADIIYARALEYRGWIAIAKCDYSEAVRKFRAALSHLDGCRHYDRFLEANALQALSFFAYEMLDRDLGWYVARRAAALDWSAQGLTTPRFWITLNESFLHEADARIDEALDSAGRAERLAPSPGLALEAMCRRANVLAHEGERYGLRDLAREIRESFEALDHASLAGDERSVALAVAEVLAQAGDGMNARRALAIYRANGELSSMLSLSGDPRRDAYERLVEAQAADANGDFTGSHHGYRDALQIFQRIGYKGRALQAAIRLGELTGQSYLFAYAGKVASALARGSWFRRRLDQHPTPTGDEMVSRLTENQLAVLRHVCDGLTNREIATERGRSEHTIRNVLARELFPRFGVRSRSELVSECVRRGFYTGRRATDRGVG
jgi:DNA-binding NarL/FixJ family response regulator